MEINQEQIDQLKAMLEKFKNEKEELEAILSKQKEEKEKDKKKGWDDIVY